MYEVKNKAAIAKLGKLRVGTLTTTPTYDASTYDARSGTSSSKYIHMWSNHGRDGILTQKCLTA